MEKCLIIHCAPTLADIKTANLFKYAFSSQESLKQTIADMNRLLSPKGVFAEILRIRDNSALLYVYRLSRLISDLNQPGVKEFLAGYGYQETSVGKYISHLKERFSCSHEFPHEVGLFLGYPLDDVTGFIENEGRNSKCTGFWKVYGDKYGAERLFTKYRNCRNIYTRMFSRGKPIERLIVSA